MSTLLIKCNNKKAHTYPDREEGEGNVLMFLEGDSLFIKCTDKCCKTWNKIQVKFHGVNVDFSKASFVQSKVKRGHIFKASKAQVVIED